MQASKLSTDNSERLHAGMRRIVVHDGQVHMTIDGVKFNEQHDTELGHSCTNRTGTKKLQLHTSNCECGDLLSR